MNNPVNRILITGVAGFLGRTLARYFSRRGISIYGIDKSTVENAPQADLKAYASIALPDKQLDGLISEWGPQAVIHCAGRASVLHSMKNPAGDFDNGPVLTFFVLDALRRQAPDCTFILLSSAAVYGNPEHLPISENDAPAPISAYGFHKLQSELLCQEFALLYQLRTVSARVFSAYGPGLRRQVMWDLAYKALTGEELLIEGTGQESRDFIHAKDIARALDSILTNAPKQGEFYNVASGEQTKILDLAEMLLKGLNRSIPIRTSGLSKPGVPLNWQANISRISELGFTPQISLDEGVRSFAVWFRQEMV